MYLEQDKEKKMREFNLGEFIELLTRGEETAKDFIECEKARNITFAECREGYHSSIEADIERPLSSVEVNIVDIAFQFAFINGWLAHKKNGDNNDK